MVPITPKTRRATATMMFCAFQTSITDKIINVNELYNVILKCDNVSDLNDTVKLCLKSIIEDMENKNSKEYSKHVRIMLKYIDENYTKKISLQDVAESVHMSINHACRLFKSEFACGGIFATKGYSPCSEKIF